MKKLLPTSTALSVNKFKGFTLVELLVVITVIAVLAVIGIAAFSGAQRASRDGRRRSDIDSIAKAMESNYNSMSGTYPVLTAGMFANNALPKDPVSSQPYIPVMTNSNKGFYVCAKFENGPNFNGNSSAGGPPNYSVNAINEYYCKSSQQSQ